MLSQGESNPFANGFAISVIGMFFVSVGLSAARSFHPSIGAITTSAFFAFYAILGLYRYRTGSPVSYLIILDHWKDSLSWQSAEAIVNRFHLLDLAAIVHTRA